MIFYNEARVDGLMKRVETPTEMTEEYTDRDDFLYYKHVDFGKRPKKFGPQDGSTLKMNTLYLLSLGILEIFQMKHTSDKNICTLLAIKVKSL
jgi:hypothetical protein